MCVCATPKTKQAIKNYELEEKTSIRYINNNGTTAQQIVKSVCAQHIIISLTVEREREGHTRREPETRLRCNVIITNIEVKEEEKRKERFVRFMRVL